MSNLKPCPFCGEPTLFHVITQFTDNWEEQPYTKITCDRCTASIQSDSRESAIAAWDRRASPKRLKPSEVTEEGWYWFIERREKYARELVIVHIGKGPDGKLYLENSRSGELLQLPNDCNITDRFIGPLVAPELENEK